MLMLPERCLADEFWERDPFRFRKSDNVSVRFPRRLRFISNIYDKLTLMLHWFCYSSKFAPLVLQGLENVRVVEARILEHLAGSPIVLD